MRLSHLLSSFLLALSLPLNALVWQVNYEKAQQLSKKENKPLLLFFNGSDWSGHAMRMKHEVLNTSIFQEKIGQHFVCVEIDFPQHKTLPQIILKQNEGLKKRFNIDEIPSFLLLDSYERIIAQIGYLPENEEQLAQDLIKVLELDQQLVSALENLEKKPEELRVDYSIAQELGHLEGIEKILEVGCKREDPFFLLEKYRLLVEKGEMKREHASLLRSKIISLDSSAQEIHFRLALIEFQQLSQCLTPLNDAIAPLAEYLLRYGKIDQTNTWRIEMMIAQFYMENDEKESALVHAEKALKTAPVGMHNEIAHSLDYIRKSTTH